MYTIVRFEYCSCLCLISSMTFPFFMNSWHYPFVGNWWVVECYRQIFVLLQSAVFLPGFCPEAFFWKSGEKYRLWLLCIKYPNVSPFLTISVQQQVQKVTICQTYSVCEIPSSQRLWIIPFLASGFCPSQKGRVRYRRKKHARKTNTSCLSSLKGKANKRHHCHPEWDWKPWLFFSTKLSWECWHQEKVLPWVTSRCPKVILCCSQHTCSCAVLCFSTLCSLFLQLKAFSASCPGIPSKAGVFLKSR